MKARGEITADQLLMCMSMSSNWLLASSINHAYVDLAHGQKDDSVREINDNL